MRGQHRPQGFDHSRGYGLRGEELEDARPVFYGQKRLCRVITPGRTTSPKAVALWFGSGVLMCEFPHSKL